MTPEVNININTSMPLTYTEYWLGGSSSTVTLTRNVEMVRRYRPKSVNNPIRADGTRPPSVFVHQWKRFMNPAVQFTALHSNGVRRAGQTFLLIGNAGASDTQLTEARPFWLDRSTVDPDLFLCDNEAKTKLFNRLTTGKGPDGVDFGESLRELGESSRLVTSLADRSVSALDRIWRDRRKAYGRIQSREQLVRLLKAVDNRRSKEALARARYLAGKQGADIVSDWLGYQFGIKPLVGDIEAAGVELSRLINDETKNLGYRLTIRAGAERLVQMITDESSGVNAIFRTKCELFVRMQAHYSVTVGYPYPSASRFEALGLNNPYATLYNTTRASWLVDYALGVGDWLRSLTPALNGYANHQFIEGSRSWLQAGYKEFVGLIPASGQSVSGNPTAPLQWAAGQFNRTVLSSFPLPPVAPVVRTKLGLTQLANALAFLTTAFGRGR